MRKVLSHKDKDYYLIYPTEPVAATALTRSKSPRSRGPVYEPKILFDKYCISGKKAFTSLMDNLYPEELWDGAAIMEFLKCYQDNFLEVMTDILKDYDSRVMLASGHHSGMGEEPIVSLTKVFPNKNSESRYGGMPIEMCAFPWRDENGIEYLQVPASKGRNPALNFELTETSNSGWVLFRPNSVLIADTYHDVKDLLNEKYGEGDEIPHEVFLQCHSAEILHILKHGKVNYFNSLSNSDTKINGPQQADWLN